jgi:hypothetical protein
MLLPMSLLAHIVSYVGLYLLVHNIHDKLTNRSSFVGRRYWRFSSHYSNVQGPPLPVRPFTVQKRGATLLFECTI